MAQPAKPKAKAAQPPAKLVKEVSDGVMGRLNAPPPPGTQAAPVAPKLAEIVKKVVPALLQGWMLASAGPITPEVLGRLIDLAAGVVKDLLADAMARPESASAPVPTT